MSDEFNNIQDKIRLNGVKNISTENLIFYLYYATKNPELKTIDKKKIEDYFYKINYSFFFENIFTNTGNYSQLSIIIVGLLIPFYLNYPRMYNLGFFGFLIGISSFVSLYQLVHSLYGSFFPSASRLFITLNIIFYFVFFVLFNKLNHISLFFISSIVSFCIINYLYRLILTTPSKSNNYNKLNVTFENKKDFMEYDYILADVCNEIIKRFGLKLPSGKMLYSYLTVFKIGDNKHKVSDFLVNLFSPFLTIGYNYFLGSFLNSLVNNEYNGTDLNVIPIIGISPFSSKYLTCQANYVLPIEFNFNSFLHEFYQEKELDDEQYRIFVKAIKRINFELLDKYQPKFEKIESLSKEELKKHLKKGSKDRNHILIQLEEFFKDKEIIGKNDNLSNHFDNNDYIVKLKDYIKDSNIKEKDKYDAIQLYHKINQTLEIKTNFSKSENNMKKNTLTNDYTENIDLAIQVLLDDENIKNESKVLLKELCQNYVDYFRKNIKEEKLYGYNYNLLTYSLFNRDFRLGSNSIFIFLMRLISTYVLFSRPITSPWLLSIFALIPVIGFDKYFKYFTEDNFIMKYLSMGMDDEYFKEEFKNEINNNTILKKAEKFIYKFLLYIFIALPFLQFYNNVFYGLTFSPNYVNIIYQIIFIINLIGTMNADSLGLEPLTFNIVFWILVLIISTIIYFIFKNK